MSDPERELGIERMADDEWFQGRVIDARNALAMARADERQRIRRRLADLLETWGDTEVPAYQIISKCADLLGDSDVV